MYENLQALIDFGTCSCMNMCGPKRLQLDDTDSADERAGHHARRFTEVTRIKEIEWKSGLTREATASKSNARPTSRRSKTDGWFIDLSNDQTWNMFQHIHL